MANVALGAPTKDFFVGMLTRDIDLNDAILDLLDNCLDGVVRQKKDIAKRSSQDFYKGYYSNIVVSNDLFMIEDNCGGIPRDVAEKYAFRMGRSASKVDDDLPTVGIYGIGMKRAIFKIGKSANVVTRHNNVLYQVSIPLKWAESESEWDFPITEPENNDRLKNGGTLIQISTINSAIAENWDTDDKLGKFVELLIKAIQQSYSFIIQKGFVITINGQEVLPLPIQLLVSTNHDGNSIKPFLYNQVFDDVSVSLAVGFYAPPPSPEDMDAAAELKRASSDAGWTIVCNDRVVLYNDRTHLTGWGIGGVPQYHTQFIGIRGLVIFESNNPKNLPMTTTKRGIDTSSNIYSVVKDRMQQGLKMFTDYTNRWKGRNESERVFSTATQSVTIDALVGETKAIEAAIPVKFKPNRGGYIFNPELPKPLNERSTKIISYSKEIDDILDVVEFIYKDRTHPVSPSQVGEKCFDLVLKKAQDKEGE